LVVEDEPYVRTILGTAPESNGYILSTAEDGETALRWLDENPTDLVLLDLRMPGMGGMEMLRRLRARGNGVPVVIVTEHGGIPDVVRAMELGAIDFLSRPVAPEALRGVIAEVIARHVDRPIPDRPAQPASAPAGALSRAKRALNRRDFDEAYDALVAAALGDLRCAEARYLMGVLCELRGQRQLAYGAYWSALQADPHCEPAMLRLLNKFSKHYEM
jgi:DNA-binding response OmpR family regulator